MARLTGAADTLYESATVLDRAVADGEFTQSIAAARAQLGEAAFTAVWAEGRAMTTEQAIQYALEEGEP
jgi:hypothetical protein